MYKHTPHVITCEDGVTTIRKREFKPKVVYEEDLDRTQCYNIDNECVRDGEDQICKCHIK